MSMLGFAGLLRLSFKYPKYFRHLLFRKVRMAARFWRVKYFKFPRRAPLPICYELVLTYKCNLRCRMCFQWGDHGWCKRMDPEFANKELDLAVAERLMGSHLIFKPSFILFGGEPLLYSRIRELMHLFKRKRCFAYIGTNGLLLSDLVDAIKGNPYLIFAVSLDGLQTTNDAIRGKGVFEKVIYNVRNLKKLKRPPYIGCEFTVLPQNVGEMYAFCKAMIASGIDWILFNLCWFISEQQAQGYEEIVGRKFGVTPRTHLGYLFEHDLDRRVFAEQYRLIESEKWPVQISWMPSLKNADQIRDYLDTPEDTLGRQKCFKQWIRMDVQPSGEIVACKQFPDLIMGDLNTHSTSEAWNSNEFLDFRKMIDERLLPICSKCNQLYLYDPSR